MHLFLLRQDLGQCWLEKIRKTFSSKSDPSRCRGVLKSPLCLVKAALEGNKKGSVMEEKHASRWFFRKFIRVVFYFSWFHPVFVGNLLQLLARSSFYECLWRGDEGPWYRSISSLYHSLTWILALHSNLCFARRSLRQTEWNTYTHARARTHALTYASMSFH